MIERKWFRKFLLVLTLLAVVALYVLISMLIEWLT